MREGRGKSESLIDPELRHHFAELQDLHHPVAFYPWLWKTYEALVALVRHPSSNTAQRRLDNVRALFDPAAASFAPLLSARDAATIELEQKITARDQAALTERNSKIATLNHALAANSARIATLDEQVANANRTIGKRDAALTERDSKIATLDQALAAEISENCDP